MSWRYYLTLHEITDLQVIREFCPSSISWVHSDEHSTGDLQRQLNTLKHKPIQLKKENIFNQTFIDFCWLILSNYMTNNSKVSNLNTLTCMKWTISTCTIRHQIHNKDLLLGLTRNTSKFNSWIQLSMMHKHDRPAMYFQGRNSILKRICKKLPKFQLFLNLFNEWPYHDSL